MDAREIIEKFGGQSALAALIDKGQSTVSYWAKTGSIPAKWQPRLLLLAIKHGIPLTASDFVAVPIETPIPSPELPSVTNATAQSSSHLTHQQKQKSEGGHLSFPASDQVVNLRFDAHSQALWATTREIGDLFEVGANTVVRHIQNIYEEQELVEGATSTKFVLVQNEGDRTVSREVLHYNLDMILSVGYRVNAKKATAFRQWATQTLRTYLEQGFVVNEKALRESPEKLNRLAAQIRSLRSEEKQVYAKVRECFKISSSDYDPESKQVKTFYALLQDKFHHAVTGMTASKLVMDRADHTAENMGLQSMKGLAPTLADAETGKNYLREDELYRLHLLSEQFLLFAESTALAGQKMTMESLHLQLDRLLTLNNYPVFDGYKDFIKNEAMQHAKLEYNLYKKRLKIESMGVPYNEEDLAAGLYDDLLIQ